MTTTATQNEISRLAYKLKWTTAVQYRKHISTGASFEDNLLSLLRTADDERERALVKRRLKAASFPVQKTLDTFHFDQSSLPNLKQEQILELATCDFIKERTNVVAIGNCGTGKSHLMSAIGLEAVRKGYSVKFRRVNDLLTQLSEARSSHHLNAMLSGLLKCQLLILDELCEASHNSSYGKLIIMQSWKQTPCSAKEKLASNFA